MGALAPVTAILRNPRPESASISPDNFKKEAKIFLNPFANSIILDIS
jgi:hypothetical protein